MGDTNQGMIEDEFKSIYSRMHMTKLCGQRYIFISFNMFNPIQDGRGKKASVPVYPL